MRLLAALCAGVMVVVLVVIGVTGSASASSNCKTSKEKWVACNAANEVIAEETIDGTGGESTITTANITIDCKTSSLVTSYIFGIPWVSGLATSNCSVARPSGCSVISSFEGEVSGVLAGAVPGGPPEEELTGHGAGGLITTLKITGCSVEGSYNLAGKQTCKYSSGYETAQETHEVSCSGGKGCSGGTLKFGTENAEFARTITDHLASKAKWSIQLN
jgi:hypothetical protein